MSKDLRTMDEIVCPDCRKPLIATPVEGKPNAYTFFGCNCNKEMYFLPETCIVAGFESAPLFFYQPKVLQSAEQRNF